eukprot:2903010-Amphidinium_carterae.1
MAFGRHKSTLRVLHRPIDPPACTAPPPQLAFRQPLETSERAFATTQDPAPPWIHLSEIATTAHRACNYEC